MGSADPPGKIDEKYRKRNHATKNSFLCLGLCHILRTIRAGKCKKRRYADHIFILLYFRMHHFVIRFSKFSSPQAALIPLTKILRTFLLDSRVSASVSAWKASCTSHCICTEIKKTRWLEMQTTTTTLSSPERLSESVVVKRHAGFRLTTPPSALRSPLIRQHFQLPAPDLLTQARVEICRLRLEAAERSTSSFHPRQKHSYSSHSASII